MASTRGIRRRTALGITASAAVAAAVVALLPGAGGARASVGKTAGSSGTVRVLYAASLAHVMNNAIASAFHRATGYTLSGYPAGSKELAAEIKGKVRQGDVFVSASPKVDLTLEGRKNGSWVSWYAPFASTTLVLGYNRSSSFASAIRTGPWYRVITQPGFRLGFTDPTLDPKGVLTVAALEAAAKRYSDPAVAQIAGDQSDLFPEEDLVGRLQSGQLDAGFFYSVEASAAKIPTVSLGSIREVATYTITALNNAPDTAGGEAFIKFLLSSQGRRLLRKAGLAYVRPVASGRGVPYLLSSVIKS